MKNKETIVLVLTFLLIFSIHLYSITENTYSNTDTFSYLTSAKSLTELKYAKIYLTEEPFQDWILPFFPLIISPFYLFDITDFYSIRVFITFLSLLASILIYLFLRKLSEFNKFECLVITAIISLSIMFNIYSRTILAEIPFMIIILVIFLLFLRKETEDLNSLIIIFFLLLASILTRATAIILFPSIVLYALIKKKYKLIIPAALSLIISFAYFYLSKNDYFFGGVPGKVFGSGSSFVLDKLTVVIQNLYFYFINILPSNLFPAIIYTKQLMIAAGILISLISIYGYILRIKKAEFIEMYYPIHVVFFLICAINEGNGRYMMPILPLFVYYFFLGLRNVINRINITKFSITPWKQFYIIMILFLICSTTFAIGMAHSHKTKPQPLLWDDLDEIGEYLKNNLNEDDILFSNNQHTPAIYLVSGIPFTAINSSAQSLSDFNYSGSAYFLSEADDPMQEYPGAIYTTKNGYYTISYQK